MYLDFLVPIPDVRGKITTKQKGDSIYVNYEVGRQYDSGKKYNVPKRSTIGKLSKADVNNISGIIERSIDEHIRAYIRIPDGYRYREE